MTEKSVWTVGSTGRTIILQVKRGGDLIEEMKKVCKLNGIKAASIQCCIGAVAEGNILNPLPKKDGKLCPGYGDALNIEGPVQLLSAQGTVSELNGEIVIHMHGIVADSNNRVFGGHYVEGKNIITFAGEVVIQEYKDVLMVKEYNEYAQGEQMIPKKC